MALGRVTAPRWWEWLVPAVVVGIGLGLAGADDWDWTRFWPTVIVAGATTMGLVGRQHHSGRHRP